MLSLMVTGNTLRTIFQHSLVQMLIRFQGRCSLTCSSGNFLKQRIGKQTLLFLQFDIFVTNRKSLMLIDFGRNPFVVSLAGDAWISKFNIVPLLAPNF